MLVATSAVTLLGGLPKGLELRALIGSTFLIAGLLATGAAAIFPVMLYSMLAPENFERAFDAAPSPGALVAALAWWPVPFILAASCFVSRRYAGKTSTSRENRGYY